MKNIKRKYEDSDKLKARKYYLLGLSISEVSKLTDFPVRTLQKWQSKEEWVKEKKCENLKLKLIELRQQGKTFKEISIIFNISISSIWRYCNK